MLRSIPFIGAGIALSLLVQSCQQGQINDAMLKTLQHHQVAIDAHTQAIKASIDFHNEQLKMNDALLKALGR